MKLGFLASHGGSNMQAVIDACKAGKLKATPAVVISNNQSSGAMKRALFEGVPAVCLNGKTHSDFNNLDKAIAETLQQYQVDFVILAGYMQKVGLKTISDFSGRIINIHPSLLPKHGGKGMYGIKVHQAVLDADETESGITIHIVNENYDEGQIIAQKKVAVLPNDTAESLAARILLEEHKFLVETLVKITSKEIILSGTANI